MPAAPARVPIRVRRPRWLALIAAAVLASGSAAGVPLAENDFLVTDFSADKVFVFAPTGALKTEITARDLGMLDVPVGVAVRKDGFAFVTNVGSQLIVRVDPGVDPPAQVLISALVNPRGIAIDASSDLGSDLFVSSPSTDQILRIDSVTGAGTAVASGGILLFPSGLVRETSGKLVVADGSTFGPKVMRVDPETGTQTPLSSGGLLRVPRDVEADPSGGFLVIDSGASNPFVAPSVIRIDDTIPFNPNQPTANQETWVACPQQFVSPRGIAVEASGSVLVADFSAKQVYRINPNPPRVCTPLLNPSPLVGPWDVAVAPVITPFDPTDLLVAGGTADQVYRVDPGDGTSVPLWPGLSFEDPVAVIRALNGDYFVLEKSTIQRVTPGGTQTLVATVTQDLVSDLAVDLTGIAVDANGELLVTDGANDRLLRVFPATGAYIVRADDDADPPAPLGAPAGLALDRNGTVLIANGGKPNDTPAVAPGLVRVNPSSGTASAVVNDAQFDEIVAVALDTNGDYVFSDRKPDPESNTASDTVWRLRVSTPGAVILYPVSVGNDMTSLQGLAIDLNRSVLVSNQIDPDQTSPPPAKEILRLDPTNGPQTEVAPIPVFSDIRGIALDRIPSPPPLDSDGDGVLEEVDNCPELANPDQLDTDDDGLGDPCDGDDDGDGVLDGADNCRIVANATQVDTDHDGCGQFCDFDINNNGVVSAGEVSIASGQFGSGACGAPACPGPPFNCCICDFNQDGICTAGEVSIVAGSFAKKPGPSGITTAECNTALCNCTPAP